MSKQLWIVTVSCDVVVYAEDADEATEIAGDVVRRGDSEPEAEHAVPMTYLPAAWDGDCIPYGDDHEDKTIGALIAEGAAPKYTVAKAGTVSR